MKKSLKITDKNKFEKVNTKNRSEEKTEPVEDRNSVIRVK